MKTKDLTDAQLLEYFREHVRYEIQMLLNATYGIMMQFVVPNGFQHMPVESFAIHLRNLITFLYPFTSRPGDVCAEDFFVNDETWEKLRPELSKVLEIAKKRADKEVGHLTTSRQVGTPASKRWDVRGLAMDLIPLIELFCNSADKFELKSEIKDIMIYYNFKIVNKI